MSPVLTLKRCRKAAVILALTGLSSSLAFAEGIAYYRCKDHCTPCHTGVDKNLLKTKYNCTKFSYETSNRIAFLSEDSTMAFTVKSLDEFLATQPTVFVATFSDRVEDNIIVLAPRSVTEIDSTLRLAGGRTRLFFSDAMTTDTVTQGLVYTPDFLRQVETLARSQAPRVSADLPLKFVNDKGQLKAHVLTDRKIE